MRLRFVEVCCGDGAASRAAEETRLFDATLGVDVDPAALEAFADTFPDATTAALELPRDEEQLLAQLPDSPFHIHFQAPGCGNGDLSLLTWALDVVRKLRERGAPCSFCIECASREEAKTALEGAKVAFRAITSDGNELRPRLLSASTSLPLATAQCVRDLLRNYLDNVVLEEEDDDPFEYEPRAKRAKPASPKVQMSMMDFVTRTDNSTLTVVPTRT